MDKKKELQEGIREGKIEFKFPIENYLTQPIEKKRKPGRPKTSTKVITQGNTPEDGTKEGERRMTYIVTREQIEQIDAIAYWERRMIKEVVSQALQDYINKYEKKNGKVKPKPKK